MTPGLPRDIWMKDLWEAWTDILSTLEIIRNEESAQRELFGMHLLQMSGGHPGRTSRIKTSVRSRNPRKQACRCGDPSPEGADVHDPKGVQKQSGLEKFGLRSRSLDDPLG